MIAHQWYEMAMLAKFDQLVNDSTTVRTTINVIAERNYGIIRRGSNRSEKCFQRGSTSMYVTNRNYSSSHSLPATFAKSTTPKSVQL
jgi:hypothetical protein